MDHRAFLSFFLSFGEDMRGIRLSNRQFHKGYSVRFASVIIRMILLAMQ